MTITEWLNQIFVLTKKLNSLKTLKSYYEEKANSIPGGNYDEPVVQKTREGRAPFIKWIDKLMDVDKKIEEAEANLKQVTKSTVDTINLIDNYDYRNLLMMRYVYLEQWEDIAMELSVSMATVKRWNYAAKKEIEKLIRDEPS